MSTRKIHNPFPIIGPYAGIYSHGVETVNAAHMLQTSGQVGQDLEGYVSDGFREQCYLAFHNVREVLKKADMDFQNVSKMNFYLTRQEDMKDLIAIRKELIDGVSPAVTVLFVAGLVNPNWLFEVDAVAIK